MKPISAAEAANSSGLPFASRLAAALVASVVFGACGDSSSGPDGPAPTPVPASIRVSPSQVSLSWIGDSATIKAEVLDQFGSRMSGLAVAWESEGPGIVSVDPAGTVHAVGRGSTAAVAKVGAVRTAVSVTVEPVPTTLILSASEVRLVGIGDTARLVASAKDQGGTEVGGSSPVWASSDPTVVEADASGRLTAVGLGRATVTATVGVLVGTVAVAVEEAAASIVVTPEFALLTSIGASTSFAAVVSDQSGGPIEGARVTWETTTPEYVAASSTGEVTAVAPGQGFVVVRYGVLADSAVVRVDPEPASIRVAVDTTTLSWIGETVELTADVLDAGGTPIGGLATLWSVETPYVAQVDPQGRITAAHAGITNVTASFAGLSATTTVVVRQIPVGVDLFMGPEVDSLYVLLGEGVTVSLEARDAGGAVIPDDTASWTTADPSIASLHQTFPRGAHVRGITAGQTWLIGTLRGVSDSIIVRAVSPDDYPIAYLNGGKILRVTAYGGVPREITPPLLPTSLLTWSPDGRHLAYGGGGNIYVIGEDGAGSSVVENDGAYRVRPIWSPDGRWIAFQEPKSAYFGGVYRARPDGTEAQRIIPASAGAQWFDWSPEGDRIVFSGIANGVVGVHLINADGKGLRLLQATTKTEYVSWSPTGDRIAFDHQLNDENWEVFTISPDGTDLVNVTNTPSIQESVPKWSPDGTRLAFRSVTGPLWRHELHVVQADGTGRENWTPEHDHNHIDWVWSPGGGSILSSNGVDYGKDLEITHPTGVRLLGKGSWPAWRR